MTTPKARTTKPHVDDQQLEKTLKDTFPASDAPSGNVIEHKATRPAHRAPAGIDKATVDRLAKQAKEKLGKA